MTTPAQPGSDATRYMRAYYYTFTPTGCDPIDAILEAIARAGKSFHCTSCWDESCESAPNGYWRLIEERAEKAAELLQPQHPAPAAEIGTAEKVAALLATKTKDELLERIKTATPEEREVGKLAPEPEATAGESESPSSVLAWVSTRPPLVIEPYAADHNKLAWEADGFALWRLEAHEPKAGDLPAAWGFSEQPAESGAREWEVYEHEHGHVSTKPGAGYPRDRMPIRVREVQGRGEHIQPTKDELIALGALPGFYGREEHRLSVMRDMVLRAMRGTPPPAAEDQA